MECNLLLLNEDLIIRDFPNINQDNKPKRKEIIWDLLKTRLIRF
jgi:hypothetical protein